MLPDTTPVSQLPGHIRIRMQYNFCAAAAAQLQIVLQLLRLFKSSLIALISDSPEEKAC